jgi:intracellular multiplication protein IcmO
MPKFDYRKHEFKRDNVLKDTRDHAKKFADKIRNPQAAAIMFFMCAVGIVAHPWFTYAADILFFYNTLYFLWFIFLSRTYELPFKMPKTADRIDPHNKGPGGSGARKAEGILFIGNEDRTSEEIWFTNSDARTHILYLGTTGAGKTEGLKSLVTNALGWGSGFVYVDGKADTDLWGSLSALARRFGRDDDLLVLNYMTGNSDTRTASNTINPFSQGSASYLSNLLTSLMPEGGGDNAMWKDRAVSLINALMPVLTWQRTNQEKVLNISVIREALNFKRVIELSRESAIPERLRKGLKGYLDTLPGFTDSAFNDDGTEKPNPSGPPMDYSTVYQQHGYLSMQFTRQLQSLADDYGYIFETPAADIDMMDVVLNRRILVVLIPALEKSADETANLGKIVGSMLKGMMGATLGSSVEGDTELALENKPTRSSTPFMAVFDEVGYYTTQGMGVMAAQARSLGFCLVFASQDLPAMEKRVKEEARSIVANCNLKIFGKLEDPTQTKEFFEKTVGEATIIESSSRKQVKAMFGQKKFDDTDTFNVASRAKASYDQLKSFKEGQAIVTFGDRVIQAKMFYSDIGKIKSLRVNKFISLPHPDPDNKRGSVDVDAILERVRDKNWTAANSSSKTQKVALYDDLAKYFVEGQRKGKRAALEAACYAVTRVSGVTPESMKAAMAAAAKAKPATPEPSAATASTAAKPSTPPPTRPLTAKDPEDPTTKKVATGTAETVSWEALMKDEAAEKKPSADAKTDAPQKFSDLAPAAKPAAPAQKASRVPSVEETMKWDDLVKSDEPKEKKETPALPTLPKGSFGVSGFGTGFGGFGGISGIGAGLPTATTPKRPDAKPVEEKIEEALEKGETINWKDLTD